MCQDRREPTGIQSILQHIQLIISKITARETQSCICPWPSTTDKLFMVKYLKRTCGTPLVEQNEHHCKRCKQDCKTHEIRGLGINTLSANQQKKGKLLRNSIGPPIIGNTHFISRNFFDLSFSPSHHETDSYYKPISLTDHLKIVSDHINRRTWTNPMDIVSP